MEHEDIKNIRLKVLAYENENERGNHDKVWNELSRRNSFAKRKPYWLAAACVGVAVCVAIVGLQVYHDETLDTRLAHIAERLARISAQINLADEQPTEPQCTIELPVITKIEPIASKKNDYLKTSPYQPVTPVDRETKTIENIVAITPATQDSTIIPDASEIKADERPKAILGVIPSQEPEDERRTKKTNRKHYKVKFLESSPQEGYTRNNNESALILTRIKKL